MPNAKVPATVSGDVLREAMQRHEQGDLVGAIGLYSEQLASHPRDVDAMRLMAAAAHGIGASDRAVTLLDMAAVIAPDNREVTRERATLALACGDYQEALRRFQAIAESHPECASVWIDLALAQNQAGESDAATASLEQAIASEPENCQAKFELANHLHTLQHFDRAIPLFQALADSGVNLPDLYLNFGVCLHRGGYAEGAIDALRKAAQLHPEDTRAMNNLGVVMFERSRFAEAEDALLQAIEQGSPDPGTWSNLGALLNHLNRFEESLELSRLALERFPDSLPILTLAGATAMKLRDSKTALILWRRASEIAPTDPQVALEYGHCLRENGQYEEALEIWEPAFAKAPNASFAVALGTTYLLLRRFEVALAMLDWACQLAPEDPMNGSLRLAAMHYSDRTTQQEIYEASCQWARQHFAGLARELHPENSLRLRVGFVSPDLYDHPVGKMLETVLPGLRESGIDVVLYADMKVGDEQSANLISLADEWRGVAQMDDAGLTELIRTDRIDVLFDLTGHTLDNRLGVFARRAAPTQITWLGYFGTTGLETMDYIVVDDAGMDVITRTTFTEAPLYLSTPRLFHIPGCPVEVSAPPAQENGYITFGCFNNTPKITHESVEMWAETMKAVPGCKMLFNRKGFEVPRLRDQLVYEFESEGISSDRLEFISTDGYQEYLESYSRVDIVLDTAPFTGGTTTMEALWMGVPVVTLSKASLVGRMGASILHSVDRPEWIAEDPDAYIDIASQLAGDVDRLGRIRDRLRRVVESSPLCDPEGFGAELAVALHAIHQGRVSAAA